MKLFNKFVHTIKKINIYLIVLSLFIFCMTSCTTTSKKYVKESNVYKTVDTGESNEEQKPEATVKEQTTTMTTEEHKGDSGSLIGSAFRFVVQVIAFPFKLIGKILDIL